MKKIVLSKEVLEDLLQTMTAAEIGLHLGVSRNTVARRMKELGLKQSFAYRQPDVSHVLTEEYLKSVQETYTVQDVMEETGLKKSTVHKYLKKYNMLLRSAPAPQGEDHWNWRGGSFIRKNGDSEYRYVATFRDDQGKLLYKREHVLVMEESIGRELTSNEVVHHVDGDGLHNDLENLVLMTKAQHNRFHITLGCFMIDHRKLTKAQTEMLIKESTMSGIRQHILDVITYAELR